MHCSTGKVKQEYSGAGVVYDVGSVYERLAKLTDIGKRGGSCMV